MSAISFRAANTTRRREEPLRLRRRAQSFRLSPTIGRWVDLGLFVFCLAMLYAMHLQAGQETIPYHLLFLALTIVYGFRVWPMVPTAIVIAAVTLSTGG